MTVANASRGGAAAPADSMVALAGLGVRAGDTLRISARGPEAQKAVAALGELIASFPGSGEAAPPLPTGSPVQTGKAIPVAPGVATGPLVRLERAAPVVPTSPAEDPGAETRRLTAAIEEAGQTLAAAAGRAGDILAVQLALLRDPLIAGRATALIAHENRNAAAAWQAAIEEAAARYRGLDDPTLKAREADVRDAGLAVLHSLLGTRGGRAAGGTARRWCSPTILPRPRPPGSTQPACSASSTAAAARPRTPPSCCALPASRRWPAPPRWCRQQAARSPRSTAQTGEVWIDPDPARHEQISASATLPSWRRTARRPAAAACGFGTAAKSSCGPTSPASPTPAPRGAAGAVGIGLLRTEMLFLDRRGPAVRSGAGRRAARHLRGVRRTADRGARARCRRRQADALSAHGAGGQSLSRPARHPPAAGAPGAVREPAPRRAGRRARPRRPADAADGHRARDELTRARGHLDRVHEQLAKAGTAHAVAGAARHHGRGAGGGAGGREGWRPRPISSRSAPTISPSTRSPPSAAMPGSAPSPMRLIRPCCG